MFLEKPAILPGLNAKMTLCEICEHFHKGNSILQPTFGLKNFEEMKENDGEFQVSSKKDSFLQFNRYEMLYHKRPSF